VSIRETHHRIKNAPPVDGLLNDPQVIRSMEYSGAVNGPSIVRKGGFMVHSRGAQQATARVSGEETRLAPPFAIQVWSHNMVENGARHVSG